MCTKLVSRDRGHGIQCDDVMSVHLESLVVHRGSLLVVLLDVVEECCDNGAGSATGGDNHRQPQATTHWMRETEGYPCPVDMRLHPALLT